MGIHEYLHLSSKLYERNPNWNLGEKSLYMATWLKKEHPLLFARLEEDFENIEGEIYAHRECETALSLASELG
jgi:hypothetical protein